MNQTQTVRITWIFAPILASFVICCILLFWAMGRGYDFTDDAHYLIWTSNPFIYPWSVSEFGIIWHPIYKLVGGDIKSFRLAGAAALSISATIFGWSIWRLVSRHQRAAFAAPFILTITVSSFWNFVFWLPTPGYNELNLCGLMLFAAGLAFATPVFGSDISRATFPETAANAMLAAFGACVVAFAKPTTAVGAGLIGLAWLVIFRSQRSLLFAACAAVFSVLFFSAVVAVLDGNLHTFIQRKMTGIRMLAIHSPTHGLASIWQSVTDPIVDLVTYPPIRSPMLIILGIWFCWANIALWASRRTTWLVNVLSLALAAGVGITAADWRAGGNKTQEYYVSLIAPMLLLIAFGSALAIKRALSKQRMPFAFATLIAMLPMVYSIGSGASGIYHASEASVFWLSATVILAAVTQDEHRHRILVGTAMFSAVLTVAILLGATADPYRLPGPLWGQTESVQIGALSSVLLVDKATATYITDLRQAAVAHDFEVGTPIIDLTGASPGTVFALGGEAPGIPWLSGGYIGSAAYVRETLSQVPLDHLKRAWVLTTTGTTNVIPDSVLRSLGLDFPQGYEAVGHACMGVPCVEHLLWKPPAD
jgi:hypothetical protein